MREASACAAGTTSTSRILGDESTVRRTACNSEDRVLREDFGRVVVADYSTREASAKRGLSAATGFDSDGTLDWPGLHRRRRKPQVDVEGIQIEDPGQRHLLPHTVIKLTKHTKRGRLHGLREGQYRGVPLNVFELLTRPTR